MTQRSKVLEGCLQILNDTKMTPSQLQGVLDQALEMAATCSDLLRKQDAELVLTNSKVD